MTSLEAAKRYLEIIDTFHAADLTPDTADYQWFRELVSAEFYDEPAPEGATVPITCPPYPEV